MSLTSMNYKLKRLEHPLIEGDCEEDSAIIPSKKTSFLMLISIPCLYLSCYYYTLIGSKLKQNIRTIKH
jgi:hypothetical protein